MNDSVMYGMLNRRVTIPLHTTGTHQSEHAFNECIHEMQLHILTCKGHSACFLSPITNKGGEVCKTFRSGSRGMALSARVGTVGMSHSLGHTR